MAETNSLSSTNSCELREYSICVLVVNLFKHLIGQLQPVNPPASLSRVTPIGKILVRSLKPTEIVCIHIGLRLAVGAKQDAVLIVHEEFVSTARLPAKFRLACAKLDDHVRIFVEPCGNCVQILRPVGDVQRNERRVRVLFENVVS